MATLTYDKIRAVVTLKGGASKAQEIGGDTALASRAVLRALLQLSPMKRGVRVIKLSPEWYQLVRPNKPDDKDLHVFPWALGLPVHESQLEFPRTTDGLNDLDGACFVTTYHYGNAVFVPYRLATPQMISTVYSTETKMGNLITEPTTSHMLEVCTYAHHEAGLWLPKSTYQKLAREDEEARAQRKTVTREGLAWDHKNDCGVSGLYLDGRLVAEVYRCKTPKKDWIVRFIGVRLAAGGNKMGRDGYQLTVPVPRKKDALEAAENLVMLHQYGATGQKLSRG